MPDDLVTKPSQKGPPADTTPFPFAFESLEDLHALVFQVRRVADALEALVQKATVNVSISTPVQPSGASGLAGTYWWCHTCGMMVPPGHLHWQGP